MTLRSDFHFPQVAGRATWDQVWERVHALHPGAGQPLPPQVDVKVS